MKLEEIIEGLRKPVISDDVIEAAIERLEKLIPKKVLNNYQSVTVIIGNCPCCGGLVSDYRNPEKCSQCGQALYWY